MKSKLLKISLVVIVALILVVNLFIPKPSEDGDKATDISITPTYQQNNSFNKELLPNLTFNKIPKTRKIKISGVDVNNFISESDSASTNIENINIKKTSGYQIVYQNRFNSFLISIIDSPFDVYRVEAEEQFLLSLGISKEDACKLDVKITTPLYANPDEAGKQYLLSFCD